MRRRIVAFVAAMAASVALLAVACELAYPTHGLGAPAVLDGAPDASARDAAPAADAGCALAVPPGPPAQDSTTHKGALFTVAVRSVSFDDAGAGQALGFDLDGTCTCPGPPSCTSIQPACDDVGGRDHAGNSILSLLDDFFAQTTEGTLDTRIAEGRQGFLMWINDYNGGTDDTKVDVSGFTSPGILGDWDAGDDAGRYVAPKWDGNDAWNIDQQTAASAPVLVNGRWQYIPAVISTIGYVAGGVLVARLPSIILGVGPGNVKLSGVVITGKIQPDPSGWRLDGQVAGRMTTHDVLAVATALHDPSNPSGYVCGDAGAAITLRNLTCGRADVPADPQSDGKGAPCDAISVAFAFSASSAVMGAPFVGHADPVGCDGGFRECDAP